MADKEYLLGNRGRELLRYTKQKTRVISDDISRKDVRAIIRRIAQLDDIREVRSVCAEIDKALAKGKDREGFTKGNFDFYGRDMRTIAKGIVNDIKSANEKQFQTEYEERLKKIGDILEGCNLMLEYITLCVEDKIIIKAESGVWTKKVTDVMYMAKSWLKNDGGRARKLREEAQIAADKRSFELMRAAVRTAITDERKAKAEAVAKRSVVQEPTVNTGQ